MKQVEIPQCNAASTRGDIRPLKDVICGQHWCFTAVDVARVEALTNHKKRGRVRNFQPTNLVHLRNLSLSLVAFLTAVDEHFNAVGDASVGFDLMTDCEQITPGGSTCRYGMLSNILGSCIVTNFRATARIHVSAS
jgi:hypothetical protein